MTEVMFWTVADEAILFGTQSKFFFDTRQQAEEFVINIEVPECASVSFREEGEDMEVYDILDYDYEEYEITAADLHDYMYGI